MALTEKVKELAKKFPSWDEFFWLDFPWNAKEEIQKSYFQSFYNFLVLRTNIHNFSLEEINEFLGYMQSTRIEGYRFLTNLTNPDKPKLPSDEWFDEKTTEISKTLHTGLDLKILKGTAHAQKYEMGNGSLIAIRPYDFAVFKREK